MACFLNTTNKNHIVVLQMYNNNSNKKDIPKKVEVFEMLDETGEEI